MVNHALPATWMGVRRVGVLARAAQRMVTPLRIKLALAVPAIKAFVPARSSARFFPRWRRTDAHAAAPRALPSGFATANLSRPSSLGYLALQTQGPSATHNALRTFAADGFRAAQPVNRMAASLNPYRTLRALTLTSIGLRPAERLPVLAWASTLRLAAQGLIPTAVEQRRYFSSTQTTRARPSDKLPTTTLTVPLDPDLMFLMDGHAELQNCLDREAQGHQGSILFAPAEEQQGWEEAKESRPGLAAVQEVSTERFVLGARLGALERLLQMMAPAPAGEEMVARLRDAYARGVETLHVTLHGATIDEARQLLSIIGWTGERFYSLRQEMED